MSEIEEEPKRLLKVKVGLKLNIQKTKIMASSPITSWQIDEETMETVRDYFGEASKSLPEKAMAPHSNTLAWRIPGAGSPVGCHLWGRTESDTTEVTY